MHGAPDGGWGIVHFLHFLLQSFPKLFLNPVLELIIAFWIWWFIKDSKNVTRTFQRLPQRCIQNPVEHLRCGILRKEKAVNYFRKKLHLRCSAGFWICLCFITCFGAYLPRLKFPAKDFLRSLNKSLWNCKFVHTY